MTQKMNKSLHISADILKMLLGIFFVVSALAKFVAIDNFNIYVFSFGVFSYNFAVIIGWLAVSTELLLGVALITNRHHRWVCLANVLLLLGFTLFLVYAHLLGRTDSCHCMGDLLPFDPVRSILKNAVLLLLLLFVWKFANADRKPRWWLSLILTFIPLVMIVAAGWLGLCHMTFFDLQYVCTLMLCMMVVAVLLSLPCFKHWWLQAIMAVVPYVAMFILSTAANWISIEGDIPYNKGLFEETISSGSVGHEVATGRKVVGMYSKTCPYCRMASEKLSMIQQRNNLDYDKFVTIFPGDTAEGLAFFYRDSYAIRFNTDLIAVDTFMQITYGQFPLVLLVEDGKPLKVYNQNTLSEHQIVDFINQ